MVKIIYEDNDILVLDKPPGLVVDKSETQQERTLEDWLDSRFRGNDIVRNGIVHRLDKDTSGLLLIAKTQESLENLQKQFSERVVKKEYLALVHGQILEPGMVDAPIIRNPENREKFTILGPTRSYAPDLVGRQIGRQAVTEYEPVQNFQFSIFNMRTADAEQSVFNDLNKIQMRKLGKLYSDGFTLVRCFPKTGRTHQIRVHLKVAGHPIVSDEKYVGRKMYRLDRRFCKRQFLHAAKIGFKHPVSGKWMELESQLPEDLEKALGFLSYG